MRRGLGEPGKGSQQAVLLPDLHLRTFTVVSVWIGAGQTQGTDVLRRLLQESTPRERETLGIVGTGRAGTGQRGTAGRRPYDSGQGMACCGAGERVLCQVRWLTLEAAAREVGTEDCWCKLIPVLSGPVNWWGWTECRTRPF